MEDRFAPPPLTGAVAFEQSFVRRTYNWMAGGLALTAAVSGLMLADPVRIVGLYRAPGLFFGLIIAELLLVLGLSAMIHRLSFGTAALAFLFYSALNGVTLSAVLYVYTQASVMAAFVTSAGLFAGMSLYGYATKKDLTSMGSLAVMGLWGIVLGSIVNMFLGSSGLSWGLTYLMVPVFLGLTAWDAQKIKRMAESGMGSHERAGHYALLAALSLYLDFINLFLALLRILGNRRN